MGAGWLPDDRRAFGGDGAAPVAAACAAAAAAAAAAAGASDCDAAFAGGGSVRLTRRTSVPSRVGTAATWHASLGAAAQEETEWRPRSPSAVSSATCHSRQLPSQATAVSLDAHLEAHLSDAVQADVRPTEAHRLSHVGLAPAHDAQRPELHLCGLHALTYTIHA